jgi:hypothetical protein
MCDSDREKYGGAEWVRLDVDKLLDMPAKKLRTYELQTGYPIERAIDQAGAGMPAVAAQVLVWMARKQSGDNRNNPDGTAEPFSALDELKTMRIGLRRADVETEDDAVPPDSSPQPENTPEP